MIREIQDHFRFYQHFKQSFASSDFKNVFKKTIRDLSPFKFNSLKGKKILDLGCGQRFPFSLLASAYGAHVTALDINNVKPDSLPLYFWKTLRLDGSKRAIKSVVRRILFDKLYYNQLEAIAGRPLSPYKTNIEFIVADPESAKYPLSDDLFDLITSNNVLEHVADVPKYFSEVRRLLKTGGLFYGIIHNFFSLSGGHNFEWASPDTAPSPNVPPWDHLRENLFPAYVYLNRLMPDQYKAIASSQLQVILFQGRDINNDPGGSEGKTFLTPEVQAELSGFPRDLLLTRSYCIICSKR